MKEQCPNQNNVATYQGALG